MVEQQIRSQRDPQESRTKTFVIIGAGRAGTRAAETLRDEGFDGRVIMISDEDERPYDRVPLSKHYLRGVPGFHELYFHSVDFYDECHIELQLGTSVTAIDPRRREVVMDSGERHHYDKLLVATGAGVRRWTGRGGDLAGVHYVGSLADAARLRGTLLTTAGTGGRVAVIGTGWIGCEVAAAARELGLPVSLMGRGALPLEKQVGPQIAEFFRRAHADRGVDLHLGTDVVSLSGTNSVEEVVLSDGSTIDVDLVVFGIGSEPRVELAVAAGLAVEDGIVTDEYFATSVPDVFAAGDVANVHNLALGGRRRLDHYAAALVQGAGAARSMLGIREPYAQIPFFFSDQFDIWMECTGEIEGADDFVLRRLDGAEEFIAFWLRAGRLSAGMNVNIKGVPAQIKALIAHGQQVDRHRLADPTTPLDEVVVDTG